MARLWVMIGSVVFYLIVFAMMLFASLQFRVIFTDILGEDAVLPIVTDVFLNHPFLLFFTLAVVLVGQCIMFARSDRLASETLTILVGHLIMNLGLWWIYLIAIFLPLIKLVTGLIV